MRLGRASDFNAWLEKKGLQNTFVNVVDYWAEYNGLSDKVQWFWLEQVAAKLNKSPLSEEIKAQYYPDGKPLIAELEKRLKKEEVYNRFYDFVGPGGELWNLYEKAQIVSLSETKGGVTFLSFHSGVLTRANFGIVPGDGYGLCERALRSDEVQKAFNFSESDVERFLNEFDLTKIEDVEKFEKLHPGFARLAVRVWVDEYNRFFFRELNTIKELTLALGGRHLKVPVDASGAKDFERMANALYKSRLAALGDAGWDPVTGTLQTEAGSLVYPGNRLTPGSSIPAIPDEFIMRFLRLAKINFVPYGHDPVGAGSIVRMGRALDWVVHFLGTDTSFSPKEQEDLIMVSDEGRLKIQFKTPDGLEVIVDKPGPKETAHMEAIVTRYNSMPEEKKNALSADVRQEYENVKRRLEANQRLGLIANGWLIIGFAPKKDEKGNIVPDYDKYVLFQKKGIEMLYKQTDVWSITARDMILQEPKSNLKEMARIARLKQIENLEKKGKTPISLIRLVKTGRGRNVLVLAGPALDSLTKALKSGAANEVLTSYEDQFRAWLRSIPESETGDWLFIGGGTQGFEERLSAIVLEENSNRKNKFEHIGMPALITGGAEYDLNIEKFFPLSSALDWNDQFKELLAILKRIQAKSLNFLFAGGGYVLGTQIGDVLAMRDSGVALSVSVLPGLSLDNSEKGTSATDRFIMSPLGRVLINTPDLARRVYVVGKGTDALGRPRPEKTVKPLRPSDVSCRALFYGT